MAEEEQQSQRKPELIETGRLEAFSDGVMAVIITIMVLELRPPTDPPSVDIGALWGMHQKFLVYVLSFAVIGIYWNNHHLLLRATPGINGSVMWANLHLLFWLSLIPFVTAWSGDDLLAKGPALAYGGIALLAGVAYYILVRLILRANKGADIEKAIGGDFKGVASIAIYALGMAFAAIPNVSSVLSYIAYACVSIMWFIPDRRLVRR
jgi:uncharacterized membrane protein